MFRTSGTTGRTKSKSRRITKPRLSADSRGFGLCVPFQVFYDFRIPVRLDVDSVAGVEAVEKISGLVAHHAEKINVFRVIFTGERFDELGIKKLPSVKSLREEYAGLLAQKRTAYAAYKRAREDMKELYNVKSNVEHLLEIDERGQAPDREKARQ